MTPHQRLTALRVADPTAAPLDLMPLWGHRPTRTGASGIGCLSQWWPAAFMVDGPGRGSPYDQVWGIGLAATHPEAARPTAWRGLHLLGFALMQVREELRG